MSVIYSIIIPVKELNDYLNETIPYIINQSIQSWEVIIITNLPESSRWNDSRIKVVESGRVGPAAKRDLGSRIALGNILVFLDDDSYPNSNLLEISKRHFLDSTVVAIGGPGITPPNDSFWQRVSGAVFLSKLTGGAPERYVPYGQQREIDDWPSVNLMVRKCDFCEIGGFNSPYWPGEDTKLCLDLIRKTKKKILYVPDLVVWHHRRSGLRNHLKQIGGYGLHRGYFFKVYPENSRKLVYLAPSMLTIFMVASIVGFFFGDMFVKNIFFGLYVLYFASLCVGFIQIIKYESVMVGLASIFYVVPTHIWYGIRFLQGLLTTNLVSKLR